MLWRFCDPPIHARPASCEYSGTTELVPFDGTKAPKNLWLWGAGHVGRAIVDLAPANAFEIVWIDTAAERFPAEVPEHVSMLLGADPPRLVCKAPSDAHHLIVTYSHDIDLALCAALLQHDTASVGLIGSETKRARFFRRLEDMGLNPNSIVCPIGDKRLGKHPDMIAQGVVNGFLEEQVK